MKSNAAKLVPKGFVLARVGLEHATSRVLFGDYKKWSARGLTTATVSTKIAAAINAGLRSNVQFLSSRGWSR